MNTLSVVISAYNEEKNLPECLASVKNLADEIIVVDNSSTDKTATLAKKYTKHVYTQKNDPKKIDLQKNFGFTKATGNWILSLDADERVTPELAEEIKSAMSHEPLAISGYWIPRKNIIFGKWIEHTGWYPDHQLRLFKKGTGSYTAEHVHEDLHVFGETAYLEQSLLHEHYKDVAEFLSKMMIYASNEADAIEKKGYTFSYLDSLRFPSREFLSRFFAREGYKDGLHGLVLSLLMAFYHLVVFVYLWEKSGYRPVQSENFLADVKSEGVSLGKEYTYWFAHEAIKVAKGLKKIRLQIKRKFSL